MKNMWKFFRPLPRWLLWGLRRKPFVWGDPPDDGYVEPFNRDTWMAVRPRYYGLMKRLPCGCSRRLGRVVLFAMGCEKHGLGAHLAEDADA